MMNSKPKGPKPGTPSPLKGRPSPLRGRTFPHLWAAGPNPELRPIWRKWLLARNQARFRSEEWSLTWEQYLHFIKQTGGRWGRQRGCHNIARIDHRLGWHMNNVTLKSRSEVMSRIAKEKNRKEKSQ